MITLLLVSSLPLFVALGSPPELTRAPYLQEMTSHSVLIVWRTMHAMRGGVAEASAEHVDEDERVRTSPAPIYETGKPTKNHVVLINHLPSSTRFFYWIVGEDEHHPLSEAIEFKTFPEGKNASFSFAVLGDSGTASEYQKKIAALIFKHHPDFVLHTGDVIYANRVHRPMDQEFDNKFFLIYQTLAEQVPFFPVLGNHDTYIENGKPYLENFYVPQNSPGQGRYYSFNVAQAHFDALDSNESMDPGSSEYEWFKADLQKSQEPIKIVYFHHPVYSSGYHGSTLRIRKSLAPLFKQFHVTLVLNGHDHDYERTVPIQGTTYVVTGGGGAPLYPAADSSWTAYSETVYHFVLVHVNGLKLHLDAINSEGRKIDQDNLSAAHF